MENPLLSDASDRDRIPERDVVAMLAMLDYLIAEVSRIDDMSTQCLVLARNSLAETADKSFVKAH